MMPCNVFVSQELGEIVAKISDFLATKAGIDFVFEESRAEFTAIYIRDFKHCKCQITVFKSAPTPPPARFIVLPMLPKKSLETGFFVEGNCLEGDRFLFRRLWADIKEALTPSLDMDQSQSQSQQQSQKQSQKQSQQKQQKQQKQQSQKQNTDVWVRDSAEWNTIVSRASPSSKHKDLNEIVEFHTLICRLTLQPALIPILVTERNIIDYLMRHLVERCDPWCFCYAALALENVCAAAATMNIEEVNAVIRGHAAEVCRIVSPIIRGSGDDGCDKVATADRETAIYSGGSEACRACDRIFRILSEPMTITECVGKP
jgi:hypothetical protein